MTAEEINESVKKIEDLVADLHNRLGEEGGYVIIRVPCTSLSVEPDTNEMVIFFNIGAAEGR
jgi:hypothetical protein